MRAIFVCLLTALTLFISAKTKAQSDLDSSILIEFNHIVTLIKKDKVKELSQLVEYPLHRENPLPDITTPESFIAYYPTLIDSAFKQKLNAYNDTDIFSHGRYYGLVGNVFWGDIWVNDSGKITGINYSSSKERELKQKLTQKIQAGMYPSVKDWETNILVLQSDKYLIRLDYTTKGIRYASWSNGKTMADKPDLVLYHGDIEGSEGGWEWTFKSGAWQYVIEDYQMAETIEEEGYFLVIENKEIEKFRYRCKEIK